MPITLQRNVLAHFPHEVGNHLLPSFDESIRLRAMSRRYYMSDVKS